MVNVMAADEDGHRMAALPLFQHFDQAQLGRRVEVSEWFVEDKDLRLAQQAGGDPDFELVALGKIPDILSAAEDAAVEEGLEVLQELIDIAAGTIVQATHKIEIFFGSEIMDEKALVKVGGGILFPVLSSSDVLIVGDDLAFISADEVEQETEESRFAGPVISHEPYHFALSGRELRDIDDDIAIVSFDDIIDGDHTLKF